MLGTLLSLCLLLSIEVRRAQAADVENGKTLYASRCAFCHGLSGAGDGPAGAALNPPPTNFRAAGYWKGASTQTMKEVIENGKPNTAMVPFKSALSTGEIEDLLAYLKTLAPPP